jgi:hypothetical protein
MSEHLGKLLRELFVRFVFWNSLAQRLLFTPSPSRSQVITLHKSCYLTARRLRPLWRTKKRPFRWTCQRSRYVSSGCCEEGSGRGSEGCTSCCTIRMSECQSVWGSYYVSSSCLELRFVLWNQIYRVCVSKRRCFANMKGSSYRLTACCPNSRHFLRSSATGSIIHDRKHGHALFTDPTGGSK